jgi:hypothetical protein
MAPPLDPQKQLAEIEYNLTSLGARFSTIIKDAVNSTSDAFNKELIKKAGDSLSSSFSKLVQTTAEVSKNASKINKGLLDSKGLSEQLLKLKEQEKDFLEKAAVAEQRGIPIKQERIDRALRQLSVEKQILESQKAITDSTEKQVGLIGKVAGGLAKIPGLGTVINAKEVVDALRKASIGLDKNGNLVKKNTNGFGMMAIAAKTVGKQFATAMLDPAAIVGAIVKQFFALNKASVELRRLTGQTATSFNVFANGAASAVDILEVASELTKQTGLNAQNAFSQDVIANAADLKVEMGLAADEAGGIAVMAQTSGMSVDDLTASIVDSTSAFNGANRSAVSQGLVLRDVAKTSAAIKANFASNPKALSDAASQAKLLATDLNGLNAMAASLLDFESSIEAELEAQLLTGKNLNLSKARELALNDDLIGAGKEIFKNAVDLNEFGKMGRLGQEAYAKSLGMSRDQLAQIAFQTALNTGMTEEQAEAATKVTAEDMKRVEVQKNFTAALNKLMGVFAPILEKIGDLFSIPVFGPMIAGAIVLIPMLSTVGGAITGFIGLFRALRIATVADTTAKLVNAGANTTLNGTMIATGPAGAVASGGFSAMGVALRNFGRAGATAIPLLFKIALVAASIGLAFAGVGFALMQVPKILEMITPEKAAGMFVLGRAFGGLALGLAAVALSGLAALPVLLGLQKLGVLGGAIAVQASASPGGAAIAGAQKPVESPQAPAASLSLDPLVTEIKLMREEMTSLMKQVMGREIKVYLDGYLVGQGCQQAQTSSG